MDSHKREVVFVHVIFRHVCMGTFFVCCNMCFLHLLSPCVLCSCKVKCINLSLFMMHSCKITMHVEPRRFQKPDGFISHSAAVLRFTTAATLRWRILHVRTLHICLSVNAWPRIRNAILNAFYRASNGLTTCWALFWFAAAGDGMELTWSFSIRSPCGPVRAALQSGDTTPRHWFTVQGLFFACGLKDNWIMGEARVERGRLEMDGVGAPRWRDKRDGKTEMSDPFDCLRRLPVPANCSICWWKTEMGALLAVKAAPIHWCCERLGVERWQAGLKSMIVGRCAFQGSVQKRWTEFVNCNSSLWFLKAFQFAVSRVSVSEQLKLTGYFAGARCHTVICMAANLCKGVNLVKFKLSKRRGRKVMIGLWTWT